MVQLRLTDSFVERLQNLTSLKCQMTVDVKRTEFSWHYRCHVGHSFTEEELAIQQAHELEKTLGSPSE